MATTTEKEITVTSGLGNADPSQVLAGATFSSEEGFNQEGTFDPIASNIEYNGGNVEEALDKLKGAIGFVKKQLIPYPYFETTKTHYGITFTDNGDGTVIVNGTKTDSTAAYFTCRTRLATETTKMMLKAGTYKITGCPKGGSTSGNGYYIQVGCSDDSGNWVALADDTGEGDTFTLTKETQIQVVIRVLGTVTITNLTFKPMVKYVSIEDDTFESYVPNVEESLKAQQNAINDMFYVKTVSADNISISASGTTDTTVYLNLDENERFIGLAGYNVSNASTNGYGGSYGMIYKLYPESTGGYFNVSIRNIYESKEINVKVYLYLIVAKNLD